MNGKKQHWAPITLGNNYAQGCLINLHSLSYLILLTVFNNDWEAAAITRQLARYSSRLKIKELNLSSAKLLIKEFTTGKAGKQCIVYT